MKWLVFAREGRIYRYTIAERRTPYGGEKNGGEINPTLQRAKKTGHETTCPGNGKTGATWLQLQA